MKNRFLIATLLILIFSSFEISHCHELAQPKRVYVDMVADLFHYGHIEYLKKVKSFGDILIVGIHDDATVQSYKRRPILSMEERIRSVQECSYVDVILPDAPLEVTLEWIQKHRIDIVVHGDDISPESMNTFYKTPIELGIFYLVPYTSGISTTDIIKRIVNRRDLY